MIQFVRVGIFWIDLNYTDLSCWRLTLRCIRADQNTGDSLSKFSMRTSMHGTSRVSSAISVCDNYQNFISIFSNCIGSTMDRALDYGSQGISSHAGVRILWSTVHSHAKTYLSFLFQFYARHSDFQINQ